MPAERRETFEERSARVTREMEELWGLLSNLRVAHGLPALRYDSAAREVVELEAPVLTLISGGRDDA